MHVKDFSLACPEFWVEASEGLGILLCCLGTPQLVPGVCEAPDWYIGSCPRMIETGDDVFSRQDNRSFVGFVIQHVVHV